MRRIVNRLIGGKRRRSETTEFPYFDAGFKSYENVFEEERRCRIGQREPRQTARRATKRREGLFS